MNKLGQRTKVTTSGTAMSTGYVLDWGYDVLGQVTSEAHDSVTARNRGFIYDSIGNRKASIAGDTDTTQSGSLAYTADQLNRYTAIDSFSPDYDHDGNQLTIQTKADPLNPASTFNERQLEWDAENRIIALKDDLGVTIVEYTYDANSRRIAKHIPSGSTVATIYDDWNPIADYELRSSTATLQVSYLWGIDLSGTLQGAGGVGGLLSVTSPNGTYYPTYDGNGNISEYLDNTGTIAAHYEYDAFGNIVSFSESTSGVAASFKHRFSTKPQDNESGLLYYGYRSYDPVSGRWISRDPIEEEGGVNLYGFVGNGGLSY